MHICCALDVITRPLGDWFVLLLEYNQLEGEILRDVNLLDLLCFTVIFYWKEGFVSP